MTSDHDMLWRRRVYAGRVLRLSVASPIVC